ncbi:hypothetical protein ACFVZJ_15325 [Streptomyces sp. NPDC058322]|uniref:hypothetical protein n=1 Tax=Streptomyces sp. NPDC058322 TaxID=3346446 RepID=UPI0036E45F92
MSSYVPPGCRPQSSQRGRWKSGCSTSSPRRSTPEPLEERLLDIVSASVDARRSDFPRPLGAPSSTWLADLGLEGLVRGATRRAVAEFASSVGDLGAAEEEHLTATLLACLFSEFTAMPARARLTGLGGPHLRVGHRTVTKKDAPCRG